MHWGVLQIKTTFIQAQHTCVLAESVSIAHPVIYKRLSHHSGQIKGLGKKKQINRKVFSFSKRPNFENRSIHKATVHNYVYIAV